MIKIRESKKLNNLIRKIINRLCDDTNNVYIDDPEHIDDFIYLKLKPDWFSTPSYHIHTDHQDDIVDNTIFLIKKSLRTKKPIYRFSGDFTGTVYYIVDTLANIEKKLKTILKELGSEKSEKDKEIFQLEQRLAKLKSA